MINHIRILQTYCTDPYLNLATEQFLLENQPENSCTLYLWQNENTVVIGKNQNAWKECRVSLLNEEGGLLARRLSGGGAVYHDLGNLNFTFLMSNEDYDLTRQLSVIREACRLVGIPTELSGRNDVLANGKKFSGNAFYHNKTHSYHHGTLMVHVDTDKLGRYLSPPKAKLLAKGVDSVRSRVVNLGRLCPGLNCDILRDKMCEAFCNVYGMTAEIIELSKQEMNQVKRIAENIRRWEYLYGIALPFTLECDDYFPWGHVQLQLQAKGGIITGVKVFSDAMDWELPQRVENALTGCRFSLPDMAEALNAAVPKYASGLIYLLQSQEI